MSLHAERLLLKTKEDFDKLIGRTLVGIGGKRRTVTHVFIDHVRFNDETNTPRGVMFKSFKNFLRHATEITA